MYLIRGIGNIEAFNKKFPSRSMSGTIGNFDGLHLGHQAILNQVKDKARESSSASLVFFTEPHASEYFAAKDENSNPPPRICPWREKVKLLKNFGIDFAFFLQFNKSLKTMTPKSFLDDVLAQLKLKHLIIGDDFRFGAHRAGDFELLKSWGKSNGTDVIANETVLCDGVRVSSTWIREALLSSDFDLAKKTAWAPIHIFRKSSLWATAWKNYRCAYCKPLDSETKTSDSRCLCGQVSTSWKVIQWNCKYGHQTNCRWL